MCQKRPTIEAKETYHRGKRDLLLYLLVYIHTCMFTCVCVCVCVSCVCVCVWLGGCAADTKQHSKGKAGEGGLLGDAVVQLLTNGDRFNG